MINIKDIYVGGTLPKQDYTGKIIPLTKDQLTGIIIGYSMASQFKETKGA